jgi:NAD(P)-dependent dehydrogenase (short-subunit alcohol dehydrogenase family)
VRRFEGKGVVVTRTGRGIGRATAGCFADEGAGAVDASFHTGYLMVVDGACSVGLPVPGVLEVPLVPGGVR